MVGVVFIHPLIFLLPYSLHSTSQWTEDECKVLVIAAAKVFPPGTQPDPSQGGDRWGQIAVYLQTHAKTTWKRGAHDIITQVRFLSYYHVLLLDCSRARLAFVCVCVCVCVCV